MIQELFHIGPISISPFGVMLVLSLFAAYVQLRRAMEKLGIGGEDDASSIVFYCGLFGILGGKIYYAILFGDWHYVFDRAGIVWYGSFFGGLLALLATIRWRRLPMARTFDATAPALALGHGLGRIGCFLVGDDYGKPTDAPWGIAFENGLPPSTAGNLRDHFGVEVAPEISDSTLLAVHPTQLYETFACLAIWLFSLWLLRRGTRPGFLFLTVAGLLSIERFLVEFVRAKDDRFFDTLTLAQVISLAILAAVLLVAWLRRDARDDQTPPAAPAASAALAAVALTPPGASR